MNNQKNEPDILNESEQLLANEESMLIPYPMANDIEVIFEEVKP